MAKDKDLIEALGRSIKELEIQEVQNISQAEANSLIDHRHSGAKTKAEEDAQLARALAESMISDYSASAAGGHHHKRPVNHVQEEAYTNIAEMRSLKEAEAAAAGHNHGVAKSDAEEELMLSRALQESCPATKEAYKLINGLRALASNYFKNEKILSFVDEACIYLSSEEEWTSSDFKSLIYDLHNNYESHSSPEVSGFVSFMFDNLN